MLNDLRHSLRLLGKEKAFSLTVILTLAVCVGANATIFSVVHKVLLAPLPYPDADRLVAVLNGYPGAGVPRASNSAPDFFLRRERMKSFEELAQYQGWGHTVGEVGATSREQTMRVSASFFPLLGARPALGRFFHEEEMAEGNARKVVLSHGYRMDRFAGDASAVGQDLRVDGVPYEIVGVLPESFRVTSPDQPRFYVPIPYTAAHRTLDQWHNNNFAMIGRLAEGATAEQAEAEGNALNQALIAEWPVPGAEQLLRDAGFNTMVTPLQEDLVRDIRGTLALLWGGVAFVLLIWCVNIANLILARSQVRAREMATRAALGAPRSRLAREVLTHAVLLATLGGVIGIGLAAIGMRALGTLGVDQLPRGSEIAMDAPVLLFTLAIAVVAGLIFGSIPLAQLLRQNLHGVLGAESRGGTADRKALRVRSGLVTAQVALAFLLLIGAGLMLASFRAALSVDPGFEAEGVWTGFVSLPAARYEDGDARARFAETLMEEVRALPGVRNAAVTTTVPFSGNNSSSVILPEGYTPPPGESILSPYQTAVGTGYFETMGIPLREGRTFTPADGVNGQRTLILDEWLANRYYPQGDALGRRMIWGAVPGQETEENIFTIVGVVGSIKQNDLTTPDAEHVGAYYVPYRANPSSFLTLVVRGEGRTEALTSGIRDRVRELDPELPLHGIETMHGRIDESLATRRTPMLLLMGFSGIALLLATIGIYGVLAYLVAQQTREMGIRLALGSSAREIFALVVSRGAIVTGMGLGVGAVASVVGGRIMQSLLFGVEPLEPVVLMTVAVVLGLVALAACVVPAWQATRIDPVRALVAD